MFSTIPNSGLWQSISDLLNGNFNSLKPVIVNTSPVVFGENHLNNSVIFETGSLVAELPKALGVDGDTITVVNNGQTDRTFINPDGGNLFHGMFGISPGFLSASRIVYNSQTVIFTKVNDRWTYPASILPGRPYMRDQNVATETGHQYVADEIGSIQRLAPTAAVTNLQLGDFGVADLSDTIDTDTRIDYYIHPTVNCTIAFHADKPGDIMYFTGDATQNFVMTGGEVYKVRIERLDGFYWYMHIS
jgi:hypothetical protein